MKRRERLSPEQDARTSSESAPSTNQNIHQSMRREIRRRAYQDPGPPQPGRLFNSRLFPLMYGACPSLIGRQLLPMLNVIGALQRSRPDLSCRCAFWLLRLTHLLYGEGPAVGPGVLLADAPLFLDILPQEPASLLRRPTTRAALLSLVHFVLWVVLMGFQHFEVRSRQDCDGYIRSYVENHLGLTKEQSVSRSERLKAVEARLSGRVCTAGAGGGAGDEDELAWAGAVMTLCVRQLAGWDVSDHLRQVGALSGSGKGERAKLILLKK